MGQTMAEKVFARNVELQGQPCAPEMMRIMEQEGWNVQELQTAGVPYADLVELGLRKRRGPKAKKAKRK